MRPGPVLAAVQAGDETGLKHALTHGGTTEEVDGAGMGALAWAAYDGNTKLVRMLLEAGADPSVVDAVGCTPLRMAVGATNVSPYVVFVLLSDPRVDVNSREQTIVNRGGTPLHFAVHSVWRSSPAIVGLFLAEPRVDVNAVCARGRRPFDVAVDTGNAAVVRALLADPRVDVSCRADGRRRSALHEAASAGDADLVRVLLADVRFTPDSVDAEGRTPLDLARGAEAPFSRAAEEGRAAVVALLEERMAAVRS